MLLSTILLLLCCTVLHLTTLRRLRDAKLNRKFHFISSTLLLIVGLGIIFSQSAFSYLFLAIPISSSLFLLTYPSHDDNNKKYIWGYAGPVDLSDLKQESSYRKTRRIEPTLVGEQVLSASLDDTGFDYSDTNDSYAQYANSTSESYNEQTEDSSRPTSGKADIGELIRTKILVNKKFQLFAGIAIGVLLLGIIISSLLTVFRDNVDGEILNNEAEYLQGKKALENSSTIERSNLLEMPDNFSLYFSQYQGVVIHWQADEVDDGELWSQLSTEGDKSCAAIQFNKGNDIRPLRVDVENSSDYFAIFSPLDTKSMIQALAFRGNFSLCGYKFSLKGSQAVLGKHSQYGQYIDY